MAEQKRWRAEIGGKYWIVHDDFIVCQHTDDRHRMDNINYQNRNYFRTEAEAQAAADEMRKVLLRAAGELHDFQWAVAEIEKGNIVHRKGRIERYHKHVGYIEWSDYALTLDDFLATDWQIYEEK